MNEVEELALSQPLDALPALQIIHALLRRDDSQAEQDRTTACIAWLDARAATFAEVLTEVEMAIVGVIVRHYRKEGCAPTRANLGTLVPMDEPKPTACLMLLDDLDKEGDRLHNLTALDLSIPFAQRIDEFEKSRLVGQLKYAIAIATGSVGDPNARSKDAPQLSGVKDSVAFVQQRFSQGVLIDDVATQGGLLADYPREIVAAVEQAERDRADGTLRMATGIPLLDRAMEGGLQRQELIGILGSTGHRKSSTTRTMAYNAAANGAHVVYVAIESTFREETVIFHVFHCHAMATAKHRVSTVSKMKLDAGILTQAEKVELATAAVDFSRTVGRNLEMHKLASPDWVSVKATIAAAGRKRPVGMVVVDYLSLLVCEGKSRFAGDDVAQVTEIFKDAKQIAMNSNDGRGLVFVSPIAGNREGYKEATANDGAWSHTGIHKYSEIERSLDTCLYIFSAPELSATGQVRMGSCKYRRGAEIPSSLVQLNITANMLVGEPPIVSTPQKLIRGSSAGQGSGGKFSYFDADHAPRLDSRPTLQEDAVVVL